MATNFYIKFEGDPEIKGDAATTSHEDEIEIFSWSHSFNQPTKPTRSSSGGHTVEKAQHSDFSFTKYLDSSTDDLLKLCWSGKQMDKAVFTAYRADGEDDAIEYLKVEMEKVVVANMAFGGGAGDLPTENVSLAYGKVTYTYLPQKTEDGTAGENQPVTHDLEAGTVE